MFNSSRSRSETEFTEKTLPPLPINTTRMMYGMEPVEMSVMLEHVGDLRRVQSSLQRLQNARYNAYITITSYADSGPAVNADATP